MSDTAGRGGVRERRGPGDDSPANLRDKEKHVVDAQERVLPELRTR